MSSRVVRPFPTRPIAQEFLSTMPTYSYRCDTCGNQFDQFQKFSEATLTDCPACDGAIRRVIHPVGVVFKGSGWYINDSRKPAPDESKPASAKSENGSKDGDKAKSGDKPTVGETAKGAPTSDTKSAPAEKAVAAKSS
ncbi:MAG: FmdB family zinc ribbon protein [Thermomicrobiales bacterium]